jgi:hypothetical protein
MGGRLMLSGGTTFNPRRRRQPPRAFAGVGGGFSAQSSPKPGGAALDSTFPQPPFLTYNPEIEAKRRAAQRGLEDTEENVKTKLHFGHRDLLQALQNIHVGAARHRQDIGRESQRGQQKLSFEEQDAKTRAARANQDFDSQLANIGRQFAQLGHRQSEGANAAGVNDAGTQAAASAARGRNQSLAEAPVNTARERTNEDLYTALSRIAGARGELEQDAGRSLTRLGQDTHRERRLAGRQYGREGFEGKREVGRARREQAISNIDLLTQEVYNARAEHPAAFGAWKKKTPGALATVKAQGGGTPAAPQKRRRH